MEVRKGFKNTLAGQIPIEWSINKLGDVGEVKMCRRIFNHETSPEGEIPFYKIGTFGKDPDAYISQELYDKYRQKYSYPKTGDILISAAGTIGRTIVFDGKPSFYQDSNIVWLDNDSKTVTNEMLYYILQIVKYNTEGGTIQRLYNNILKNTIFICPPIEEQSSIATALSDVDALITSLEKLIVKKRNIKQGTMQQLLTGKKRLPRFNKKWDYKKLNELVTMSSGGTPPTNNPKYYEGDIPWVVIADITNAGKFIRTTEKNISQLGLNNSSAKVYKKGFILFAMYASIGKCAIAAIDTTFNQAILGIECTKIHSEYLYYYLSFNENIFKSMGQTGTQSNLNKIIVGNVIIPYPDMDEQIAIAEALSDIDVEIEALERKKHKYVLIKQGMMQELLTGKTRLV